ncbi:MULTISPECIES: AAA family ATPase [unclassified Microbacterium]|uniref:AAA family ATPase n=1 Tax=Microbacterium TaxID=33882 RepID=UPI003BA145AA
MAWIERFKVTGLAGREVPVEHELDRHVNIFWGLNGAGKTTLLKILHAGMNNDASALDDLPFTSAEIAFRVGAKDRLIVRRFSKRVSTDASEDESDLFILDDSDAEAPWAGGDNEHPSGWSTEWHSDDFDIDVAERRFSHSYLPITRVADRRRRPTYAGERRLSSDEIFVEQVRDRWRDYAAESLTRIRSIQQQGLATVLATLFGGVPTPMDARARSERIDPGEAYAMVRAFLSEQGIPLAMSRDNFATRYDTSEEHRQVVSEIQEVRRETDDVLLPQREFQSVIDSMYTGNKHLVLGAGRIPRSFGATALRVEIGDRQIPLKSLSSGEKQLLQILLEVLGASGETVMIDEPELSLHVNWQQQLVGSMQRVNQECQLLLATHSPEIMADVADDFVFEL